MDNLTEKTLRFVQSRRLLNAGEAVLVGFSGGPDSVALALILSDLSASGALPLRIVLAHLNHCLRGPESDADEQFCRHFAQERSLEIETGRLDVHRLARDGESWEAAARRLRYRFLTEAAGSRGIRAVALGHHADDAAETVLMRLLRGCGLRGLGAMPPVRPASGNPDMRIVRPLLHASKHELLAMLENRGQDHRLDSSNRDPRFLRNRVRLELMPGLATRCAGVSSLLAELNDCAVRANALLDDWLDAHWAALQAAATSDGVSLHADRYGRLPAPLRKLAVRRALSVLSEEPDYLPALSREHYDEAAGLAEAPVGAGMSLPGGFLARREHGLIHFHRGKPAPEAEAVELPVPGEVAVSFAGMRVRADALAMPADASSLIEQADDRRVFVSADALAMPLSVRARRAGDRFRPLGAPGERKLKDFFIDRKVPRHERDRVPLVVDAQERIVWVVGHAIADPFKLNGGEREVVQLEASQG